MSADAIGRLNAALSGRYKIERELGEGGMATVYLAADLRHERKVALKVLKPELAAVVGADRFLAEIKTTANLQHPHILGLHDSGEADGMLFYVMPYVEGESLRERLDREHQLPVDEAVRIATNVAEALEYAHSHGVIHRDIKPANILLQAGKPLVSDFGIALAVGTAGGGRLTETGLSLGTPHYMSPEQATGDSHVGPQTDIYALCCVLYEMLVGEPPYTGSTPQAVLGNVLQGNAVSATDVRASVPPHVDGVIRKGLERLPADRFTAASEVSRQLADLAFRYPAPSDRVRAGVTADTGWPWPKYMAVVAIIGASSLVSVGAFWAITRTSSTEVFNRVPVVVLMDTFAPRGVYDQETLDRSGTNADLLNEALRDLPLVLSKEEVGSTWDREDQILRQNPDLIVIHRSAFFHSMNLEMGFGYPDEASFDQERQPRLYAYADNKLGAFFGFIAQGRASTSFLVYSRGSPGGWLEDDFRADWVEQLEGRFPLLNGKVWTMNVPGEDALGSWRDPETIRTLREHVGMILGIELDR
jgi:hypothetical protein